MQQCDTVVYQEMTKKINTQKTKITIFNKMVNYSDMNVRLIQTVHTVVTFT